MGEEKSVPAWLFGCFVVALGLSMFLFISAEFRCVELSERYDSAMDRLYEAKEAKGYCFTCSAHTASTCYTCQRYACSNCLIGTKGGWTNWRCKSCPLAELEAIDKAIEVERERSKKAVEELEAKSKELVKDLPQRREGLEH